MSMNDCGTRCLLGSVYRAEKECFILCDIVGTTGMSASSNYARRIVWT